MREPTVIFATDLEGDPVQGLRLASRLADERGAALMVAHVVPLRRADGEGMLHGCVDLRSRDRARATRALSLDDASVVHRSELLVGEPEDELARVASEPGVELLVMEMRPRGPVERLLGKSLIERLGERVACPILTYRSRGASAREVVGTKSALEPSLGPSLARSLARSLRPSLALQIMLNARVDALLDWMERRVHAAASIARRRSVQHGVASLVGARRDGPFEGRTRDELSLELQEHWRATQAAGIELWLDVPDPLVRGVDGLEPSPACALSLGYGAQPGPERDAWMAAVMRDGAAISLPIDAAGRAGARVVLAGARVPLSSARSAVIGLAFDARRGFLRILGQPGPTPSTETYAFDGHGVMLSDSRFADQLHQVGLLPYASHTMGRLRICDPGTSLLDSWSDTEVDRWPLTDMAAAAIAGHDGVNTRGYRDYRGVPVIGAWRWLPSLHIGVAAEMDVSDAQALRS